MQRRDVLKATAALGATVLLPTSSLCAAAGQDASPLNVAVIGIGLQGRALMSACLLMKSIRFRAVCDIWDYAQRYGQYYLKSYGQEVNTYADYREMLEKESDLDAVLIASPDFVHAEQTIACLEAGVHVYCETMMADRIESARAMVRAMRASGRKLQIGYQRRSNPRYVHMKEKLLDEAGLTGVTTHAHTQWVLSISDDRGWPRRNTMADDVLQRHGYQNMSEFRNWRWFQKYCGGLFGNLGAHQVDVVNWFLDAVPKSVFANGSAGHSEGRWSKNVVALYDYAPPAGAVQCCCQMLTATRGDGTGSHESFWGTEGSLRISQNPRWTAIYRDPDGPDWDEWLRRDFLRSTEQERARRSERAAADIAETGEVERFEMPVELDKPVLYPHLENFFAAVRGEATLNCPADIALMTDAAVLKTVQAVQARERLEFAADDFAI
jgi:predicted dehydrogenase